MQLRNDLPLIRERIRERISQDQTRQGQESTKAFSLPRQAGAAPAIDDSYYPALAQKALTDALGIYVFSDENTDEDESNNLDNDFYFSVGSEEVTIDNYTTVNNASKVSSYNEINEYSLEERTYLYILVNEKGVEVEGG